MSGDAAAPDAGPTRPRRRAVILVGNPANPYSRAIRIGRTLTEAGYDVEIAATTEEGAPLEQRDGDLVIRRYPPSGIFASMAATYRWAPPSSIAGEAPADGDPRPAHVPGAIRVVVPVAAHGPRLVEDAVDRARPGRPVPRVRDAADRRGPRRARPRSQGRPHVARDPRRHRHHDGIEQRPRHPAAHPPDARPTRARLGARGRRPLDGQRGLRRQGRRALGVGHATDRRAQLPRTVDPAGRRAPARPASAPRPGCRRRPGSACSGAGSGRTSGSTRPPRRC